MRTALMCGVLLLGQSAWAAEAGSARAALEAFSSDLVSLHAAFTQHVIGTDGQLQSEGSGEVWLQKPGLFRWAYGGEYPELIVADGERVWIHDELLEQVTVKAQSSAAEDSPLLLLTEPEAVDEQFTVTEMGDYEDMQLLALVSNNPESEFERVMLGFACDTLRLMVLEDAFGLRTEIRFSDLQRNLELEPGLFRFEPVPGTDVVGDLPEDDVPESDVH